MKMVLANSLSFQGIGGMQEEACIGLFSVKNTKVNKTLSAKWQVMAGTNCFIGRFFIV